jgi:hypothetical protein
MSRNFQPLFISRSMVLLGVIFLVAAFVSYGVIYFMINAESSYTGQSAFESTQLMVWFAVALYWIIGAFFIIVVGLYMTHKVAGPLYRLEMMLDEAESGALPTEVRFRDGDQLLPLANAQSVMFSYLIHRDQELAGLWARVKKSLDALALRAESATQEEWSRLAVDLQAECSALAAETTREAEDDELPPEPSSGTLTEGRKSEP